MRNYRTLPSGSLDRARDLRRSATDAEKLLWRALREKLPAAKFRRQVPYGPYFADFLSFPAKLIVEVDGGQHALANESDAARTRYLRAQGYRVLRIWNHDVMENMDGVLEHISLSVRPHPPIADRDAGQSHVPLSRLPLPLGEGIKHHHV